MRRERAIHNGILGAGTPPSRIKDSPERRTRNERRTNDVCADNRRRRRRRRQRQGNDRGQRTDGWTPRTAGGCDLDSSMQMHWTMKWGREHSAVQGDYWTILTPMNCRLLEPLIQFYPWTRTRGRPCQHSTSLCLTLQRGSNALMNLCQRFCAVLSARLLGEKKRAPQTCTVVRENVFCLRRSLPQAYKPLFRGSFSSQVQ